MNSKVITEEALQQFAELQKEYIDSVAKVGGNFSGGGSSNIKVDSGLSTNSENPVQNKVITNKFNELKGNLTDGSVTKVGTENVGSTSSPIYLNKGIPTTCTSITATSADILTTTRNIFGQSFNGSADIKKRIYTATTSGAISINGYNYDIAIITLNGNVTNITLSSMPVAGNDIDCIFYGNGFQRLIAIANSGAYHTDTGEPLAITVPANGYVEVNFLYDGTNIWVKGV